MPFILLLFALFVVAGGIRIAGNLMGTPLTNLVILGLGTWRASLLGTTGAAMLLIRPLIRANQDRRHKTHVFVFFIFLVGNIGGSLTPLGRSAAVPRFPAWDRLQLDAPGHGHALGPFGGSPSLVFYGLDRWHWRREPQRAASRVPRRITIDGRHNFVFLALIVGSGAGERPMAFGHGHPLGLGVEVRLENALRDGLLLVIAGLSYATTRRASASRMPSPGRPSRRSAILFAGIFITIVPVLEALSAGAAGPFRGPACAWSTGPTARRSCPSISG